jgi:hypothetical protein
MDIKMPRGAIPTPRSELAASEPYRSGSDHDTHGPSADMPTPNHELGASRPYKPRGATPESFLAWPIEIDSWGSEETGNSSWAEEAFAKATADPKVFIPAEAVQNAARECGSMNFSHFMQARGFELDGTAYLDGDFYSVDWTDTAVLNAAIAHAAPVKVGIARETLVSAPFGRMTPGKNGWVAHSLEQCAPGNTCGSLCGYGDPTRLAGLFAERGVTVDVPPAMPAGLCYAIFVSGSIGILDRQSLLNITGEAWVRNPTTIVRKIAQ